VAGHYVIEGRRGPSLGASGTRLRVS
jgi:hypothetical protein